ncbi:MAG: hypothetical protein R2839_05035 [Thermomicrobiales bacterium]
MESFAVPCHQSGRIDPDALEAELKQGRVGTIVATGGTTSISAVDDIVAVLGLAERYGVREIPVDAATADSFVCWLTNRMTPCTQYLCRAAGDGRGRQCGHRPTNMVCNHTVVDPVLFRDATVCRFYKHDSPYTYFTSDDLHLGEISLECSRAGAAAAALWATLRAFPLTAGGWVRRTENTICGHRTGGTARVSRRHSGTGRSGTRHCPAHIVPASGDARTSVISALTQHICKS